jgi:glycosyltransferase involved in cell wall biosynthesis
MRILVLHSRYLSGPVSGENRVVDDEADLLRRRGHEVTVWDPSVEETATGNLMRAGAEAIWSRRASAQVRHLIQDGRPDIVHCHNMFPALSPAVLRTAQGEGATTVITLHNFRMLCLPATLLRDGRPCEDCVGRVPWPGVIHSCYRGSAPASAAIATSLVLHRRLKTFENVDLYLAVSEFVKDKHVEAGWDADRIRVKTNFTWPSPVRRGPGEYFLYLGRLSEEKGIPTLIRAWANIDEKLLVVGSGPQAAALKRTAPSNIEFRDAIPPSEVIDVLARARAVLVPSVCYEGTPRVILEAYSAGVPVLASNIGGLGEVVHDDVSGVLLAPGDSRSWQEGITRLLDDAESERLGRGASTLWGQRFAPERVAEELEAAYELALARRGKNTSEKRRG